MAKDNKIDIEINAKGGPSLKRTTKQIKKQKKSLDRLSSSGKRLDKQQARQYTRQKQGIIGTANSTKSFSKMQQSMGGGGGGGGDRHREREHVRRPPRRVRRAGLRPSFLWCVGNSMGNGDRECCGHSFTKIGRLLRDLKGIREFERCVVGGNRSKRGNVL